MYAVSFHLVLSRLKSSSNVFHEINKKNVLLGRWLLYKVELLTKSYMHKTDYSKCLGNVERTIQRPSDNIK